MHYTIYYMFDNLCSTLHANYILLPCITMYHIPHSYTTYYTLILYALRYMLHTTTIYTICQMPHSYTLYYAFDTLIF